MHLFCSCIHTFPVTFHFLSLSFPHALLLSTPVFHSLITPVYLNLCFSITLYEFIHMSVLHLMCSCFCLVCITIFLPPAILLLVLFCILGDFPASSFFIFIFLCDFKKSKALGQKIDCKKFGGNQTHVTRAVENIHTHRSTDVVVMLILMENWSFTDVLECSLTAIDVL